MRELSYFFANFNRELLWFTDNFTGEHQKKSSLRPNEVVVLAWAVFTIHHYHLRSITCLDINESKNIALRAKEQIFPITFFLSKQEDKEFFKVFFYLVTQVFASAPNIFP